MLAVSGTHGKTTTTSMLAWISGHEGLNPGFLVGGVPENFGISARRGVGFYQNAIVGLPHASIQSKLDPT